MRGVTCPCAGGSGVRADRPGGVSQPRHAKTFSYRHRCTRFSQQTWNIYWNDPLVRIIWQIVKLALHLLCYFPICMLCILVFYMFALVAFLASHPELKVSQSFVVIDAVPTYFSWAGSHMASQFWNETADRVR